MNTKPHELKIDREVSFPDPFTDGGEFITIHAHTISRVDGQDYFILTGQKDSVVHRLYLDARGYRPNTLTKDYHLPYSTAEGAEELYNEAWKQFTAPTHVTTAPESYDGFGTRTVELLPLQSHKGEQFRAVYIEPDNLDWQKGRNGSGNHATFDMEQWEEFKDSVARPIKNPCTKCNSTGYIMDIDPDNEDDTMPESWNPNEYFLRNNPVDDCPQCHA